MRTLALPYRSENGGGRDSVEPKSRLRQVIIDTILFDLDGTLVDSTAGIVEAVHYACGALHYPLPPPDAIKALMGIPIERKFEALGVKPADVAKIVELFRKRYGQICAERTVLLAGIKDALETFKRLGIVMGIVTTKQRVFTEPILRALRVEHFFSAVIGVEDVTHPKPHPEPVERALARLGAKKEHTLYVGDTVVDIETGRNSGLTTVILATGTQSYEFLASHHPQHLLRHPAELVEFVKDTNRQDAKHTKKL